MNCPSCGGELDADMVRGQPAAACESCAGVWLSAGALDKITGAEVEQQLRQEWAQEPDSCRYCQSALGFGDQCPTCGKSPTISCPSGHGVMNTAWVELAGTEVEIDQCPSCGGLWIDSHERELLHGDKKPQSSVKLEGYLPAAMRTRGSRLAHAEPQREIDRFLAAADVASYHGFSMPSMNTARLMLIVAIGLFIVFRFFAWPYISGLL